MGRSSHAGVELILRELGELLFAGEELEDDGEGEHSEGACYGGGGLRCGGGLLLRGNGNFLFEFCVMAVGFDYALEIAEFALEDIADCGEPVDAFSEENLGVFVPFGEVFPQHQKVVAVVEI